MTIEEQNAEAEHSLFLKICTEYSEGKDLKKVLTKYRVTYITFSKWLKHVERKQIFDEASDAFFMFQSHNIKMKAIQSFEKLVEGFTVTEVSEESVKGVVVKTITKEKHFAPHVQAVILALQKLLPSTYSDPHKLLPPPQQEEEEQIFKIGDREIKFK